MKKKRNNTQQNQYFIQWVLVTIVLFVYVIGTLISYSNSMKELTKQRSVDRISKQAVQIRGYYEGKLAGAMDTARYVADYISMQDDIFGEESVKAIDTLIGDSDFKQIFIVKDDGSAIDNEGKEYVTVDNSKEYQEMLEGRRIVYVGKDVTGESRVILAAPIKEGHLLKGYLLLTFVPKSMNKIITTPIYSYSLVFSDGYVAENIGNHTICDASENILEEVKNQKFLEGTYSILSQAIAGNRGTTAIVTGKDGHNYYLIAQPVKDMESEVLVTVSEEQIKRISFEDNNITEVLIIKLIVSLLIFISLLIIIYLINKMAFTKTSKELKDKAETDLLTGLYNKVSTENKIKEYMAEEGKTKTSMMCVLDIDNFKKINDTMGHAFGDEVLASLGKQIGSEFRVTDIIGRTGGDEFIIFLKDLKEDEIIIREADRVARFFKNFTVGDYAKYAATASIGVALFPRDGEDFESLYKAADSALYKAKKRGKNQMAFYKELN